MKVSELCRHIGNIDDELLQEAEQMPKIKKKKHLVHQLAAAAAVLALMVGSGAVGSFIFAQEVVVEMPVEQETIQIPEIGLTLLLPDSWKNKYALEKSDEFMEYSVYHPAIRESMEGHGGMLFYIKLWQEHLTKEQVDAGGEWSYAKCQYIMTTKDGTYLLYYASDVQFNQETLEEYRQMESQISDIRFVADNALD